MSIKNPQAQRCKALPKIRNSIRQSVLSIFSLLLLDSCGKSLDSEKIAQSIQQDVIRQGGTSLKTVICPSKVEPEAGKTFECIGEIETGYTFTIPVKQQDDRGHVTWDVPNAKGLLNVAKFETSIQEAVQTEVGFRPIVRCGDGFKPIKPGQIFECKVKVKAKPGTSKNFQAAKDSTSSNPARDPKAIAGKPSQPDRIVVSVGADGNVNWQRVMPGAVSQLLPKPAEPAGAAIGKSTNAKPATQTTPSATKPAPPAQKNAEDFLNQPGASAQFED